MNNRDNVQLRSDISQLGGGRQMAIWSQSNTHKLFKELAQGILRDFHVLLLVAGLVRCVPSTALKGYLCCPSSPM